MEELPERWWFRHDENDALLKRFKKHENKAQMQVSCPTTPLLLTFSALFTSKV